MDEVDRQFDRAFNAAAELYRQDKYEQCIEALRELLADPAMPRYHHIRCLTLLGGTLGDWKESYSCWVKAETIWRITKRWHCDDEDTEVKEALDDLQDGLNELRRALVDDKDGCHESMQDGDAEADVLNTLAAHDAGVEEDRAIAEAEGETWSDEEMSDEEMSDEDELGDEDEMSDAEESEEPNIKKEGMEGRESNETGEAVKDEKVLPYRPPHKRNPNTGKNKDIMSEPSWRRKG
ncbi:hypothetical protein HBH56_112750 [Parastagonospora nodorum]|nr:hypothetical protein HBH56_112750 [Parastagonospora nodorum]KAH3925635.1 hypothetical protein HBH54_177600 [Parastagonospora nodorum]KAH3951116.1 hypothetical protein HBH53_068420 [Parastagonospora nodorum]KAH3974350.1 hypothetical protein HBH51_089810 [Parastagonospora nodorum]KAH3979173.1 hypothetical protein HBH52_097800 [Parastagonospora nodorum]